MCEINLQTMPTHRLGIRGLNKRANGADKMISIKGEWRLGGGGGDLGVESKKR
jgi:hypothetical protein